jgi:hypothetical protein
METHQNKIIIEGWKDTTHGKELFWYYNENYGKQIIIDNEDNKSVDSFESFDKKSQISDLSENSNKSEKSNTSNKTEDELEDDDILVKEKEKRDKKQDDEKTWIKLQFLDLKRHFYDLKKLTTQLKKIMKDFNMKVTTKKLNYFIEEFEKEYQTKNKSLSNNNLSLNQNMNSKNLLSLFPNPVQNRLFISNEFSGTYEVLDLKGKIISSELYSPLGINVGIMTPGIYFLKTQTGLYRFVKE